MLDWVGRMMAFVFLIVPVICLFWALSLVLKEGRVTVVVKG